MKDLSIVQFEITYYPKGSQVVLDELRELKFAFPYSYEEEFFSNCVGKEPIKGEGAFPAHLYTPHGEYYRVLVPFMAIAVQGFAGFSNDIYAGAVEFEVNNKGVSEVFDDFLVEIWNLALPHFKKHPNLVDCKSCFDG